MKSSKKKNTKKETRRQDNNDWEPFAEEVKPQQQSQQDLLGSVISNPIPRTKSLISLLTLNLVTQQNKDDEFDDWAPFEETSNKPEPIQPQSQNIFTPIPSNSNILFCFFNIF